MKSSSCLYSSTCVEYFLSFRHLLSVECSSIAERYLTSKKHTQKKPSLMTLNSDIKSAYSL